MEDLETYQTPLARSDPPFLYRPDPLVRKLIENFENHTADMRARRWHTSFPPLSVPVSPTHLHPDGIATDLTRSDVCSNRTGTTLGESCGSILRSRRRSSGFRFPMRPSNKWRATSFVPPPNIGLLLALSTYTWGDFCVVSRPEAVRDRR